MTGNLGQKLLYKPAQSSKVSPQRALSSLRLKKWRQLIYLSELFVGNAKYLSQNTLQNCRLLVLNPGHNVSFAQFYN